MEASTKLPQPSPSSVVDAGLDEDIVDAQPDVRDMVEQALELLEQTGDIVQASLPDCERAGDRLEAYRQAHLDPIAAVDVLYQRRFEKEFKRLQPEYRKRYKIAWARVKPVLDKCKGTPKVKRVFLEIWGEDVDASLPAPPPGTPP